MKRFLLLAAALVAVAVTAGAARADAPRVSRGDAQALFQAQFNAGGAIRLHGGDVLQGAPVQPGVRVGPLPNNNGRHLCSLDWHLIELGMLDAFPQGEDAHSQAVAELSAVDLEMLLDGAPLALDTTATKAVDPMSTDLAAGPGFIGYSKNWGAILSPSDLAVGAHTLQLVSPSALPPITFFIDAAGTGACL
jgi:hypothetical protein